MSAPLTIRGVILIPTSGDRSGRVQHLDQGRLSRFRRVGDEVSGIATSVGSR